MAQQVKLRRSSVAGNKPTTTQLELGELAINTNDGKLYFEKSSSLGESIQEIIVTDAWNTGSINISGSVTISGSITATSFTGSLLGTASYARQALSSSYALVSTSASYANNATTASYSLTSTSASYATQALSSSYANNATSASYALTSTSASFATTASYANNATSASYSATSSYANNFTVAGTLTAQTLIVQTVTSSIIYASGSNQLGDATNDTQLLIGTTKITGSLQVTGSTNLSGSLNVSNGITGSLLGTASYAPNALSASYATQALSASYAPSALSSSYAETASFAMAVSGSGVVGNISGNATNITAFTIDQDLGVSDQVSFGGVTASFLGNLTGTASYATNALSASYSLTSTSASYALSASYAATSTSASYALTASYAATASSAQNASDILVYVKNSSGAQINKGKVVRIVGAVGDNPLIATASYQDDNNSANTLGITYQNIPNDDFGYVITEGTLLGVNTDTFTAGQLIYLGATGSFIGTAPVAPLHAVRLGEVLRSQLNNGSIYVRVDNGYELGELHDVRDTSTTSSYGDLLIKSGSVWTNSNQLTGSYGLTGSLNATSFTGSLLGTASYATQALNATTASYVATASYVPTLQQVTNQGNITTTAITSSGLYVSGSATISGNLNVLGTASFAVVTSSVVIVGDSTIVLSTDLPAVRFGGIEVVDSGSFGNSSTGSLLWDSLNNRWIYSNPSGSTYDGGLLISGPRNTSGLGNEVGTTLNAILKGQGGDHLTSSALIENGTSTNFYSNAAIITSAGSVTATSFTGSLSGSLLGTASYATQALSASYALNTTSASYALNATSASYALTSTSASYASNALSASYARQAATASYYSGSLFAPGSTTQILYNNAGTIAGDSGLVYSGSRVGIGITNPTNKLEVIGSTRISGSTIITGSLDVNGTARVSGSVTTNSANGFRLDSAGSILFSLGYSGGTLLDRLTGTAIRIAENGTPQLTIATGGAATFSSTITATQGIFTGAESDKVLMTRTSIGSWNLAISGTNRFSIFDVTAVAERISITSTGNVGIGTTSPNYKLDVSGSGNFTGGLTVTGSVIATSFTGSLLGTASYASNALSASYALNTTSASYALTSTSASFATNATSASYALTSTSASFATNATSAATASYANNFTVAGTLTAQTLVVQTITSSIIYSSGSNQFGDATNDTQLLIGTTKVTGSLQVTGSANISNSVSIGGASNYAPLSIRSTNAGAYAEGINLDINDGTIGSAIGIDFNTSNVDLATIPGARIQGVRIASAAVTDLVFSVRNSTPTLNEVLRLSNAGNVLVTGSLLVTGSSTITGSLRVSAGITGSLLGTASYATNALSASYYGGSVVSASYAATASYVLSAVSASYSQNSTSASFTTNATSASYALTSSYVNTLNQNVLITGSATIGAASAGASENTLTLGARDTANEGGQLGFNAPGGTWTSASFLDNWSNQFRILRGNNTTSDGLVAQWNLHTKQMQLPAYTSATSFVGTATANLAVDSGGNIITVSTTGGSVFPYTGNAVITGSLTTTGVIYAQPNGGMYFQGGDDAALYDINVANTMGIYGMQTVTEGAIKLGSNGPTLYGSGSRLGIGTTTPTSASLTVSGNVWANSFTGSLLGTSSYATLAATASYATLATTASYFSGSLLSPGSTTQILYNNGGTIAGDSGLVYSGSNVGIGTTSPATKFHIQDTNGGVFFDGSGGSYNRFKSTTSSASTGRDLLFSAQNAGTTPDLYISSSGNVGIGTTSPNRQFIVAGTGQMGLYGTSAGIVFTNAGKTFDIYSAANFSINETGVSTPFYIKAGGNIGISTTNPAAKLDIKGDLIVSSSLIINQNTASLASGAQTVSTNATSSYTAAFYNYTVASGSNARAGQVTAVWNGGSIQYTDVSTTDIGSTLAVVFTASLSGANVQLKTVLPTSGWTVKTLANLI